MTSWT